jgi:hypothetical protein
LAHPGLWGTAGYAAVTEADVERTWKSEVDLGEVELRRVPIDPDMAIRIPLQLVLSIVRALDAVRECLGTDIGSRRDALMSPIATSGFSQRNA